MKIHIKPKEQPVYIVCNRHKARPRKDVRICKQCLDRDLCADYAKHREKT